MDLNSISIFEWAFVGFPIIMVLWLIYNYVSDYRRMRQYDIEYTVESTGLINPDLRLFNGVGILYVFLFLASLIFSFPIKFDMHLDILYFVPFLIVVILINAGKAKIAFCHEGVIVRRRFYPWDAVGQLSFENKQSKSLSKKDPQYLYKAQIQVGDVPIYPLKVILKEADIKPLNKKLKKRKKGYVTLIDQV